MISYEKIKEDLRELKYYYSRKSNMEKLFLKRVKRIYLYWQKNIIASFVRHRQGCMTYTAVCISKIKHKKPWQWSFVIRPSISEG